MRLFGGLFGDTTRKPLRLRAETAEDVPALAALLQDAALKVSDMAYDARGRHLTLQVSRYCHEIGGPVPLRASCVVRIEGVMRISSRGLPLQVPNQTLSLLDLAFTPNVDTPSVGTPDLDPGGAFLLRFAGEDDKDVRVEVECVDMIVMDMSAPRRAGHKPRHDPS